MNRTHASFFSGVGGLDMGLEAAGWETVSFSEIDPYASAVLARHWPAVPNLGSIVDLAGRAEPHRVRDVADAQGIGSSGASASAGRYAAGARQAGIEHLPHDPDWTDAFLWTGGFPCQDLSVAGKRKGLAGERSGLAFAFLDLVERHRPPAIILENVPGLLSSHAGRDFGSLLRRLGELGYWWAYRVLDARYFGVPQRRRRVFIVAIHARLDPVGDGPAEVLSVGSRCDRHPTAGSQAGPGVADSSAPGVDEVVGTLGGDFGHHGGALGSQVAWQGHLRVQRPAPDPGGVRAADGLAGRLDDRAGLVNALDTAQGGADDNDAQAGRLGGRRDKMPVTLSGPAGDAPLLPDGLDSHRYRCCGNGVVAPVAEFIGERLRVVCEQLMAERAA